MTRKFAILSTFTTVLLAAYAPATASEVGFDVFTGLEDGGYSNFMKEKGLTNQTNLDGSAAIADSLCNSDEPGIGNLQLDTVWAAEQSGCELYIIGKMPRTEMVFLMAAPNSSVEELHDLSSNTRLFVDGPASGSAFTFSNFKKIETEHGRSDDWTNTPPRHGSNTLLALSTKYDAAFLVRTANSPLIIELIDNGWTPLSVSDKDINDLEWNNAPLYSKLTVKLDDPDSIFNHKIKTFEVPSVIVINEAAASSSKLVRTLKTVFGQ